MHDRDLEHVKSKIASPFTVCWVACCSHFQSLSVGVAQWFALMYAESLRAKNGSHCKTFAVQSKAPSAQDATIAHWVSKTGVVTFTITKLAIESFTCWLAFSPTDGLIRLDGRHNWRLTILYGTSESDHFSPFCRWSPWWPWSLGSDGERHWPLALCARSRGHIFN